MSVKREFRIRDYTMIQSMTAFARASVTKETSLITWEIHTLNQRYIDISFKMPEMFKFLEPQLTQCLARKIKRGKVECQLKYKPIQGENTTFMFDQRLLHTLAQATQTLQRTFDQNITLSLAELLTWPGVIQGEVGEDTALQCNILEVFEICLEELITVRQREGSAIKQLLEKNLQDLCAELEDIKKHQPFLSEQYREKLLARIASLKVSLDPVRLEQELLFVIQKSDVAEEIERLEIHLAEVQSVLNRPNAVGRRLDFLMQELNREANTLGSKCLNAYVTHKVVNLKVFMEQMREQIQNLE